MHFPVKARTLLLIAMLAADVLHAQQTSDRREMSSDDRLLVISAALGRQGFHSKPDCSHLVHEIFSRAGFPYRYSSSSDLYSGINEFHRVTSPQVADLIVWPGHMGIIVSPTQHSFYSSLRSGVGVDFYDSSYWKGRGKPRFYRYVKQTTAAEPPSSSRNTRVEEETESSIEPANVAITDTLV